MEDTTLKLRLFISSRFCVGLAIFQVLFGTVLHFIFEGFRPPINPLTVVGCLWLIVAFAIFRYVKKSLQRLEFLKKEGDGFDAEIVSINRLPKSEFAGKVAAKITCFYVNKNNEKCLVESRGLMIKRDDNPENFRVRVYACWSNPELYEMEIFRVKDSEVEFDRDYR